VMQAFSEHGDGLAQPSRCHSGLMDAGVFSCDGG
jgi:hypothetical protein